MKPNGGFCYFTFYIFSLLFPFTTSRAAAKTSRRIVFEDTNQNFTIASLSDKSKEETGISLQVMCLFDKPGLCRAVVVFIVIFCSRQ